VATDPLSRPDPIAAEEYAGRRTLAAAAAAARGLDAILVWSAGGSTLDAFGDVFYLTSHYPVEPKSWDRRPFWTGFGRAAVVLLADGDAALLVGPPDWRTDLVKIDDVRSGRDLYALVVRYLREKGLSSGRVGIVRQEIFPLPLFHEIRAELPTLELVGADDLIENLRVAKSPAEIVWMRHASRVAVEMMNNMLGAAEVGRTDADLAAIGFETAGRHGATPWEFAMSSGPYSDHAYHHRLPLFHPWRPYEAGDVVHPDVWGCVEGYFYDFQRSMVVGHNPTPAQRDVLEGAIAKVHYICDQLRPGNTARDAFEAGSRWTREHGFAEPSAAEGETDVGSIEFYGHGIGLGWDPPWLVSNDKTPFVPGMTIAVETYVSQPGVATAIYEEAVLVTDSDPEILTAGCNARWWD
jgi:Xaa-Pro dipeptidase